MTGALRVEGLSLAFVAGCLVGGAVTVESCGFFAVYFLSSFLCLALALITLYLCLERCHVWLVFLSFFVAGAFCRVCSSLPSPSISPLGLDVLSSRACASFAAALDSIPFGNEVSSEMLKALLCGDRRGVPAEIRQAFRDSGASHLLALSGLHIGIIYLIINKILSAVGNSPRVRVLRSIIIISASIFYCMMTGSGPSIVRATLFIMINEIQKLLCRPSSLLQTMSTSLLLQSVFSPASVSTPGFALSYLAILGIALIYPHLEALYPSGNSPMRYIWKSASLSISCQIGTGPLAWLLFRSAPKYFLITNLVAIPLTTLTIIFGLLTLVLHLLGICPGILIQATDFAIASLIYFLDIVSRI